MNSKIPLLAALFIAAACSPDASQQAYPQPADTSPATSASLASQDRDFLERAAEGNNAEIATGGLVDGRALRPEVIAFGHTMVADHTAANRQLATIAAAKHIVLPTTLGDHQLGYDRVVSRRLDPFDQEFMRVMVEDHQTAVELFRSEASSGADPALKAFAAATLPTIEAHLAHANTIVATAAPPQELTAPPTPGATQAPPASTVPRTTPVQNQRTPTTAAPAQKKHG